ncbi:MAG: hypothetical protein AAFX87_30935, partial [Bacteroidota bacterium]
MDDKFLDIHDNQKGIKLTGDGLRLSDSERGKILMTIELPLDNYEISINIDLADKSKLPIRLARDAKNTLNIDGYLEKGTHKITIRKYDNQLYFFVDNDLISIKEDHYVPFNRVLLLSPKTKYVIFRSLVILKITKSNYLSENGFFNSEKRNAIITEIYNRRHTKYPKTDSLLNELEVLASSNDK